MADIYFDPYPKNFGDLDTSNIMRVNLKSQWQPYVIGLAEDATIRPYQPETTPTPFQTWTEFGRDHVTALGHLVNWTHFEKEDNFVSQVYLEGFTYADAPMRDLVDLAASWIDPVALNLEGTRFSAIEGGHSKIERAYQISRHGSGDFVGLLEASEDRVAIKPVFVIHNWGEKEADTVLLDGKELVQGQDYRQGLEGTSLVVWLNRDLVKSSRIEIVE